MALPNPNEPEGPIVDVFRCLINSDTQPKLLLPNAHLINILQKEFYMDTVLMQKFELELYMDVLKHIFRNWPNWDNFSQTINKLKKEGDQEEINKALKINHAEMKEYLSGMLDIAQELARDKVRKLNMLNEKKLRQVVMEVEGSVHQLRSLFYRRPLNNSIFNANKATPAVQIPRKFTFESIVNWFGVEIEISARANTKILVYKRQNLHKLTHRLVNKKLKEKMPCHPYLKTSVLVKSKNSSINVLKVDLMRHFRESLSSDENTKWRPVSGVLEMIIDDLAHLPEVIDISCDYRRHMSERKYVRYFTQEVCEGVDTDKFDLHLEEVVSPLSEYNFKVTDVVDNEHGTSVTLTCIYCQITFIGSNCVSDILRHFTLIHMSEPDWKCLTCSKTFTMCYLTKTTWNHSCVVSLCA